MNATIASMGKWLCGGALAASLAWNATTLRRAPREAGGCGDGSCAAAVSKLEKLGGLDVDESQRAKLVALLHACDEQSAGSDARAGELSREIRSLLLDPAVAPATIRARAKELGALRAGAIESCVESAVGLRELLAPEQLRRLLEACCGDGCGASCGTGR